MFALRRFFNIALAIVILFSGYEAAIPLYEAYKQPTWAARTAPLLLAMPWTIGFVLGTIYAMIVWSPQSDGSE